MIYKGVTVSKGSELYSLLESGKPEDKKKAEALFAKIDAEFHKHFPKETYERLQGNFHEVTKRLKKQAELTNND